MKNFWHIIKLIFILLLLVVGLHFVLRPLSPSDVKSDIYSIKFLAGYDKLYQIQGTRLDCEPTGNVLTAHCTTVFEDRLLEIEVRYQDNHRTTAKSCSIKYAGEPVICTPSWDYEHRSPSVIIWENLGVSVERFAQLRQQNPLLYWYEQRFIQIAYALSGVLAVIAIIWSWIKFPANRVLPASNFQNFYRGWQSNHILLHGLYSLSCGILTFVTMYFFLMCDLLLLGFID